MYLLVCVMTFPLEVFSHFAPKVGHLVDEFVLGFPVDDGQVLQNAGQMLHAEPGHHEKLHHAEEEGTDGVIDEFFLQEAFLIEGMYDVDDGEPDAQLDDAAREAERFEGDTLPSAGPDAGAHFRRDGYEHGHGQERA